MEIGEFVFQPLLPKYDKANIQNLKEICLGIKGQIRWSEISVTVGSASAKFYCTLEKYFG